MPDPYDPKPWIQKGPPPADEATRKRAATPAPETNNDPNTGDWAPVASSGFPLPPPPREAERIGRYEVRTELGAGAFGRVVLCFDPVVKRLVAVKQPSGKGMAPTFVAQFLKEAQAAAEIHHPNVCPVYDAGTHGQMPYIVMRYVQGGTLRDLFKARGAAMSDRDKLKIALKLARGLAAAHEKGVIHRDLKPANVLYDDAAREVLITDFGLAHLVDVNSSDSGAIKGTPVYMPPEQCGTKSFGPITPVADVYSLGVMLYEMLAGRPPFVADTTHELLIQHITTFPLPPSGVRPGLDPRLDTLVLKALEKQPADRYPSARAFADAIADYLRGKESDAEVAGPLPLPLTPPAPVPPVAPPPLPPSSARREPPPVLPAAAAPVLDAIPLEVIRCPKCGSRLEIVANQTKPVKCPKCEIRFTVEAGRQAEARSATHRPLTAEPLRPVRRPGLSGRPGTDDNGIPRPDWHRTAAGTRIAALGVLVLVMCWLVVAGLAFAVRLDDQWEVSFGWPAGGLAVAVLVVGLGQALAARVPGGVGGGRAAQLAAACTFTAVLGVGLAALDFVSAQQTAPLSATVDWRAYQVAIGALGVGLLFLFLGGVAFNRYLMAVRRELDEPFPRGGISVSGVFLVVLLSSVLIGGPAAGGAVALGSGAGAAFCTIVAAGAGAIVLLVVPVWGLVALGLNLFAAGAIARHARG